MVPIAGRIMVVAEQVEGMSEEPLDNGHHRAVGKIHVSWLIPGTEPGNAGGCLHQDDLLPQFPVLSRPGFKLLTQTALLRNAVRVFICHRDVSLQERHFLKPVELSIPRWGMGPPSKGENFLRCFVFLKRK